MDADFWQAHFAEQKAKADKIKELEELIASGGAGAAKAKVELHQLKVWHGKLNIHIYHVCHRTKIQPRPQRMRWVLCLQRWLVGIHMCALGGVVEMRCLIGCGWALLLYIDV